MTVWDFRMWLESHIPLWMLGLFPLTVWLLGQVVFRLFKPQVLTSNIPFGYKKGDHIMFSGKSYIVTGVISKTTITIRRPFKQWLRDIFRRST